MHAGPVAGLVAQMLLMAAIAAAVAVSGVSLNAAGWVVGVACGLITNLALAYGLAHYRADRMSPADWVTLARATLAVGVAALVAASFGQRVDIAMLVSLAALALVLDALDGWVARRTVTGTLGARFDGEVDAFLILVLSVYVARSSGAWVLAIGAARYVFLAAEWPLAWMRAPLPPRNWRKVVAAIQGIVLAIAVAGVLSVAVTQAALVGALVLLTESFVRDVWWLWRRRHRARDGPLVDVPAGRSHTLIGPALTILAALIVWLALVAPDQPQQLEPTAFMRVPLEGLVLVASVAFLPTIARRILAGIAGPALALLVIVKILNFGFFTTFDRPFDPIGDSSNVGVGIETLRAAVGHSEANLIVVGVVLGAVVLVVLTTFAVFRLTRVAVGQRRRATRTVTALGAVWALCWMFGAHLLSHTPIASTSAAGLVVDEVRAVQADFHDQGCSPTRFGRTASATLPAASCSPPCAGRMS